MDVEARVVDAWCSTGVLSLIIAITDVSRALHICVPIPLTNKISHHGRVIQEGVIVQRTFRGRSTILWVETLVLHTSQTGCLALPLGLTAPVLLQGWEWRELGFQKPVFPKAGLGQFSWSSNTAFSEQGRNRLIRIFPLRAGPTYVHHDGKSK